MKKSFCILVLLLFASAVFAANFVPKPMVISAPTTVQYDFDGKTLTIPITVSGTPSSTFFVVNTKDKAASISQVRNGYLGWHYVNGIDTCVYVSPAIQFDVGQQEIIWTGKDNDGNMVPSGEYTYYIWGFDNVSAKTSMTKQLTPAPWSRTFIMTHDESGNPLSNPILWKGSGTKPKDEVLVNHKNYKWVIGTDPLDATLLETCITVGSCDVGHPVFDPTDHTMFFKGGLWTLKGLKVTRKWQWVPNGDAILQTNWGENGESSFTSDAPGNWDHGPGVTYGGGDYLLNVNAECSGATTMSELVYVDINDGTEIKRLDLTEWWTNLDDAAKGGQSTSGPTELDLMGNTVVMGAHTCCVNMLVDVNYEADDEAILWVNINGDYTGDHNWETTSARPWVCNDYNVGPYKYDIRMEKNGFSFFPSYDMGAVSFGLYAPDGTGMGYQALAAETAMQKFGTQEISYGSPYDGLLVSNQSVIPKSGATTEQKAEGAGWFWVGSDSFKGVITSSQVAVEEAPAAFSVAQNSPNPFNPSTTISFSIPEAGQVSVDVFNVAGQKIDTVANEFMSAGSHSVVWDASGFSAGVFFYTVKSGDFAKTMKMTLLK